jgi:hypothetical protein
MEPIEQQLHTLKEVSLPEGMHQSILRRVNYLKLRPLLFIALFVCSINVLVLSSHISNKLVEVEFTDMIHDFTRDSYANLLVISILLEKFFEVISVEMIASLFVNIAGAIYMSNKLVSYRLGRIN